MQCDICGKGGDLVSVFAATGLVRVCRHGHFEGEIQDAWTGMFIHMTGDKPTDALVWFPEGYIPSLRHKLLDMKPPIWTGQDHYA